MTPGAIITWAFCLLLGVGALSGIGWFTFGPNKKKSDDLALQDTGKGTKAEEGDKKKVEGPTDQESDKEARGMAKEGGGGPGRPQPGKAPPADPLDDGGLGAPPPGKEPKEPDPAIEEARKAEEAALEERRLNDAKLKAEAEEERIRLAKVEADREEQRQNKARAEAEAEVEKLMKKDGLSENDKLYVRGYVHRRWAHSPTVDVSKLSLNVTKPQLFKDGDLGVPTYPNRFLDAKRLAGTSSSMKIVQIIGEDEMIIYPGYVGIKGVSTAGLTAGLKDGSRAELKGRVFLVAGTTPYTTSEGKEEKAPRLIEVDFKKIRPVINSAEVKTWQEAIPDHLKAKAEGLPKTEGIKKTEAASAIPRIGGLWVEEGVHRVAIVQKGKDFVASCTYQHPKFGTISWRMKGTIAKDGSVSGRLQHTKGPPAWTKNLQDRTGLLSADGNTIDGLYVWRRVK